MKLQVQVMFGKNSQRMKSFLCERQRVTHHVRSPLLGQYLVEDIRVSAREYASSGSIRNLGQGSGRSPVGIDIHRVQDGPAPHNQSKTLTSRRTADRVVAIGDQNEYLPYVGLVPCRQFLRDASQRVITRSWPIGLYDLELSRCRGGPAISRAHCLRLQSGERDDRQTIRARERSFQNEVANDLQSRTKALLDGLARIDQYDYIESGFMRPCQTTEFANHNAAIHYSEIIAAQIRHKLVVLVRGKERDPHF